jgi:hypothetical protein
VNLTRKLCGLVILLGLAACTTTPTPYAAATGDLGYRDQQIETNRYRVSFTGNSATPVNRVQDYALYRAAELTVANGYDYFEVANRSTDSSGGAVGGPSVGVGLGGFSGGSGGVGIGLSSILGGGGGYSQGYTVSMDIVMFRGEKPPADQSAYDAHQVLQRLRPTIQAPPA